MTHKKGDYPLITPFSSLDQGYSPALNPEYYTPGPACSKGPGKRGHIVADTLLPTQMFPRLPARATFAATQFLCPGHKNVSDFVQKHFVSATNVSQFAQPKNHHKQQCVCNNVYSFAVP